MIFIMIIKDPVCQMCDQDNTGSQIQKDCRDANINLIAIIIIKTAAVLL